MDGLVKRTDPGRAYRSRIPSFGAHRIGLRFCRLGYRGLPQARNWAVRPGHRRGLRPGRPAGNSATLAMTRRSMRMPASAKPAVAWWKPSPTLCMTRATTSRKGPSSGRSRARSDPRRLPAGKAPGIPVLSKGKGVLMSEPGNASGPAVRCRDYPRRYQELRPGRRQGARNAARPDPSFTSPFSRLFGVCIQVPFRQPCRSASGHLDRRSITRTRISHLAELARRIPHSRDVNCPAGP
jgi:hypothetical protein